MTTDVAFIDDMDRAARSLRAAVVSAHMQGLDVDDIHRLVEAGIADAAQYVITRMSLERSARLDHHPDGEDRLPPVDESTDGTVDDMSIPVLHPSIPRTRRHAA